MLAIDELTRLMMELNADGYATSLQYDLAKKVITFECNLSDLDMKALAIRILSEEKSKELGYL